MIFIRVKNVLVTATALLFASVTPLFAQQAPLYETVPFDLLMVRPENGGGTFRMLPILFPNDVRPNPLPKEGTLTVTFEDEPNDLYEIDWLAVAKIETYQEMLLAELQKVLRSENYEAAYGYFEYFFKYYPNYPGIQSLYESTLLSEAKRFLSQGDEPNAVTRFGRLYAENKNHAELKAIWCNLIDTKLAALMQKEDCNEMRKIINVFETRYANNEVNRKWLDAIDRLTQNYRSQAEQFLQQGLYLEALDALEHTRRVAATPNAFPEMEQLIKKRCPQIVVGVSQLPTMPESIALQPDQRFVDMERQAPLTNSTVRSQRLFNRMLIEYSSSGIDGGIYTSPLGTFSQGGNGVRLYWELYPELKWANGASNVTCYDVAETLERVLFSKNSLIDHGDRDAVSQKRLQNGCFDDYIVPNLFESVGIENGNRVVVQLKHHSLFPESRLRVPIEKSRTYAISAFDDGDKTGDAQTVGNGAYLLRRFDFPFVKTNRDYAQVIYLRNLNDSFSEKPQPCMLIERTLPTSTGNAQLLVQGDIDVLEHVPPKSVRQLRNQAGVKLGKYATLQTHFLLPNSNKPVTSSRTFLRGMLYALDRNWILGKLLENSNVPGEVVSAPWPKRVAVDDPFGYAYNNAILPRAYEPKLAIALALTAFNQVRVREEKRRAMLEMQQIEAANKESTNKESTNKEITARHATDTNFGATSLDEQKRDSEGYLVLVPNEMVLAYPPSETAYQACQMIQQQWRAIGIPVRLVEYRPNEQVGRGTDIDFWFVEMSMLEPYTDIEILFGRNGMVARQSAYLGQALSRLRNSQNWSDVAAAFEDVHRIVYEETTVLPLWQYESYYAWRDRISGISGDQIQLYETSEQWDVPQTERQ